MATAQAKEQNQQIDEVAEREAKIASMSIYERLSHIQSEIKVIKGQYNDYGGYKYRSAEDIEAAAKPICREYHTTLTITDKLEIVDGWHYVTAHAILRPWEATEEVIEITASAREAESKKGMDSSQVTGSTSSYARKYALGGLFQLDDTADADVPQKTMNELITEALRLRNSLKEVEIDVHAPEIEKWLLSTTKLKSADPTAQKNGRDVEKIVNAYQVLLDGKKKKDAQKQPVGN